MIHKGKIYVLSKFPPIGRRVDTNRIGQDVLSFIQRSRAASTLDELIAHLLDRYDVPEARLRQDVQRFLEDAIRNDVLVHKEVLDESRAFEEEIRTRQAKLAELVVSHFGYVARYGPELTPGCQSCRRGKWAVLSIGAECNLRCAFCPQVDHSALAYANPEHRPGDDELIFAFGLEFSSHRELKFQFSLIHDQYDGFAWVGGEPMLPEVQRRILPLIRYFHETYPTYHQWLYTNGMFATAETMNELAQAGIRELRFDLAATRFSPKGIAAMKLAKGIFPYVCLEIPMLKATYEGLMDNIQAILDTGLDQMNLAEFLVGSHHLRDPDRHLRDEGKLYSYKGFMISPISSRRYTYDVIERAARERWSVVINDCGNEYKYYKLSIQERKHISVFQGRKGYWANDSSVADMDAVNDRWTTP